MPWPTTPLPAEHDPDRAVVPGLALRLGDLLAGRYRLEGLLACEASAVTLAGRQVHGREPVLVEVLAGYSDADEVEVAARLGQARRAALLHDAHVARVLDIGRTADGMPFVVTTRPAGDTLEDVLERRGRFSVEEAVDVALQISAALAEAHAHGLVHGDVEPRRVIVARAADGHGLHATLLGFGTARPTTSVGEASASTWFGSPSYIAPEHTRGSGVVDARADVWSVAVLVHELVAGAPPFEGESVPSVLVAVAYDAAPLLTDAPYELAVVLARCLAKDPATRVASIEALADQLAPFAGPRGAERAAAVHAAAEGARRRLAREAARHEARGGRRSTPPPAHHERHRAKVLLDGSHEEATSPRAPTTSGGALRDQPTTRSQRIQRVQRRTRFGVLVALAVTALAASSLAVGRRGASAGAGGATEELLRAEVPFAVAPFRPDVEPPPERTVSAAALPDAPPRPARAPERPRGPSFLAPAPRPPPRPSAPPPLVRTPTWPSGPTAMPAPTPPKPLTTRPPTPQAAPAKPGASRLFSERK